MAKQIYLPAVLAERLGYYKEQGLDVELLDTRAGVEAENELLAGAAQGVVGFYDHSLDLQATGKYIESVVQFSPEPGAGEPVSAESSPQVTAPADLQGTTTDRGSRREAGVSLVEIAGDA